MATSNAALTCCDRLCGLAASTRPGSPLWEYAEAVEQDANPQSAIELFQAAVAMFDSIGTAIGSDRPGIHTLAQPARARVWFARNQAQYGRAVADKRVLSMGEAIELALSYHFASEPVSR